MIVRIFQKKLLMGSGLIYISLAYEYYLQFYFITLAHKISFLTSLLLEFR